MSREPPTHNAIWVRELAAELKLEGHSVRRLLTQAGLETRELNAEGARIPFSKHAAFFELAAKATGDNCLGLHFGSTRDVCDAGLLGYVGISSPTVADVINNFSRYQRLYSDAIQTEMSELEDWASRSKALGCPPRRAAEA